MVDTSVTATKKITNAELIIAQGRTTGTQASTFTFDGSGGTSGSITMTYQKIGNFVTLHIPAVSATTGTGSTVLTANTALPAAIRPAAETQLCSMTGVVNNGANSDAAGVITITTAGIVNLQRDGSGTAWTNSAVGGTSTGTTITYFVG